MAFGQRKLSATGKKLKKKKSTQNGGEDDEASGDNQFKSFNICKKTLMGLTYSGYKVPTEIQSASIGLAIEGCDILGAAKTGSGKTLAFLIPLLEKLENEKWTNLDGMGALIITPTRELAYQIFETINKIGLYHDFSVGLIIGGKDLKFERHRMNKCNIVICTPGRLLQHMNENPLFNCDNTRILVLDEADRILDMGFKKTMDAIIDYLPKERQTLLFSATQTKSVKDLARLSLKDPKYVAVHEQSNSVTPEGLIEKYVVCEAHQKLNALWSFIKQNLSKKILVFVSTCKQVKFIFELFCRMKPGTSMMALYGSLHQLRRMNIYNDFKSSKRACLIATDIASRGLDFPAVNWVVQLDCPEDTNQYIHRAGRTARYHKGGESLLFLTPSEEKSMVEQLIARKVPIKKSSIDHHGSIIRKAEALLARDVALKETAQRAFKSYLKDVYMMKDKTVFDVTTIDKDMLSRSFGLIVTPRVRFLENKGLNNRNKSTSSVPLNDEDKDNPVEIKSKKLFTLTGHASDESDGEDFFTSKKVAVIPDIEITPEPLVRTSKGKIVTQAALARKILRKNLTVNKKIVFDTEGKPVEEFPMEQKSEKIKLLDEKCKSGIDINIAKEIMEDEDKIDKELQRKLIKEKHKAKRLKEREEKKVKAEEARKRFAERKGLAKSDPKSHDEDEGTSQDESDPDDSEREDQLNEYIDQLPDPDLYYNNDDDEDDDDGEEREEEEDDDDDDDDDENPRKRLKTRDSSDEDDEEDLPLTLQDAETIAKQFIDN
ncbi:probable ATP-dependent RNA helicase DDX10 [Panonychus citri]|uniref:probable ATP-dependent RNA helicase DDX10 n=1 Tax=Panonychus citri TaxID=50023 RepID=UPI0023077863|nr:probable ATP-dependent RNA helicase DDX10 [Panonychus citri]